tara:strand:+ start:84 stop:1175 length:1092 start_codon:yes stop_codon:yes gene_type:complete
MDDRINTSNAGKFSDGTVDNITAKHNQGLISAVAVVDRRPDEPTAELKDQRSLKYSSFIWNAPKTPPPPPSSGTPPHDFRTPAQKADGWKLKDTTSAGDQWAHKYGWAYKETKEQGQFPKNELYFDQTGPASKIRGKLFLHSDLGSYVDEAKMFLSPGENVTVGGTPINRSVAMNINVGAERWAIEREIEKIGGNRPWHYTSLWRHRAKKRGIELSSPWSMYNPITPALNSEYFQDNTNEGMISNPSDLFVFIDQDMKWHPSPAFIPPINMVTDSMDKAFFEGQNEQLRYRMYHMPSRINGGKYTLGFADGHAEQKTNTGPTDPNQMGELGVGFPVDKAAWDFLSTVSLSTGSGGGSVPHGEF